MSENMSADVIDSKSAAVGHALRNPVLRRVLVAYLVFNVAELAVWIALLVYGYSRDGVQGASLIGVLQLAPAALVAPVAASWCARMPAARALVIGYGLQAVAFLANGVALLAGAPFFIVLITAVLGACAITLTRPVHNALIPEISATTSDLTACNTASGVVEATAVFLGPLASGVLIVPRGPGGVILVMGLLSVVSVLMTMRLRSAPRSELAAHDGDLGGSVLRALLRDPVSRLMIGMVGAENLLVGMLDILLVALAFQVLHMSSSGVGILNAAVGVGGLIGAAFSIVLVGRRNLSLSILIAAAACGVPIALSGSTSVVAVAIVLLAISGAGKLFFDVGSRTLVQRALPDELLTGVFGVAESAMMAGLAVGALLTPLLLNSAGERGAFVVAGTFLPLVVLLSFRRLRTLDKEAVVPPVNLRLLMGVPLIAVLSPRIVERLAARMQFVEHAAGQTVIKVGEPGELFYVIEAGRALVTHDGRTLRELGPGQWFGELALLRGEPRSATVTAITPMRLGTLARRPFLVAVTGSESAVAVADQHARTYLAPTQGRPRRKRNSP
jgi:Cyclic nucleotide-binding domain